MFASVVGRRERAGAGAMAWTIGRGRGELCAAGEAGAGGAGGPGDCTDGSGQRCGGGAGAHVDVQCREERSRGPDPDRSRREKAGGKEAIDGTAVSARGWVGAQRKPGLFRGGTTGGGGGERGDEPKNEIPGGGRARARRRGRGWGRSREGAVRGAGQRRAAEDDGCAAAPANRLDQGLIPLRCPRSTRWCSSGATTRARGGQAAAVRGGRSGGRGTYRGRGNSRGCGGAGVAGQAHTAAEYNEPHRIVDCGRVLAAFLYEKLAA